MALQVWLPLTGDLKNLGLDDITVTNNGATINTAGKIGSCYDFVSSYITFPTPLPKTITEFSVAAWVNLNTGYTVNNGMHILNLGKSYGRICVSKDSAALKVLLSDNTTNVHFASNLSASQLSANIWHHYAFTFDNGIASIYIDGVLDKSETLQISNVVYTADNITIGSVGTEYSNAKLNDLRIYDNCLSPKEVKELSKGLVAHCPLNDGIGGANIAWNSSLATDLTNWSKSGDWDFVTKEGFKCCHHTGAFQTTGVLYPKQTFNTTTDGMLPYNGLIITMSADVLLENVVKGTTNYYLALYQSGETINGSWRSPAVIANSGHFISAASNLLDPDKLNGKGWTHVWATYKWGNYAWSNTNYKLQFYARDYTGDVYVKNLKIELGEKPTPWIPNPADVLYSKMGLDNGIVYDCSGYGHHGNIVGTGVSYSSEVPRYTCSTDFQQSDANNSYINLGTGGKVSDEITVSEWVYMDSWTTDPHPFSCTEGGGWNIGKNSNKPTFPVYVNTVGYVHSINGDISTPLWTELSSGWHMFTGTYDGFNVKLYIDGELVANKATGKTDKLPIHYHATNPIVIHSEATSTTGSNSYPACKMSDMRIYATALSAEDIKSLYETRASIDNYSNTYAYEFMEV